MIAEHRLRECGMATTAVIVVFALLLLAFGFLYVARLAKIGGEAASLQNAADAAALAGAQAIVRELPSEILIAIRDGSTLPGGLGQGEASAFALRNDATLVGYQFSPSHDLIEVTVRSRQPLETGQLEYAKASARIGVRIGECRVPLKPTPTPTPSPAPRETREPSPSLAPPIPWAGIASCGALSVPVILPAAPQGLPQLSIGGAAFKAWFNPRLAL